MEANLDIPLTARWRPLYLRDFQSKQASFIFKHIMLLYQYPTDPTWHFLSTLGRDDRMEFTSLSNASRSAIVVIECINSLFSFLFSVFLYISFALASKINLCPAMS